MPPIAEWLVSHAFADTGAHAPPDWLPAIGTSFGSSTDTACPRPGVGQKPRPATSRRTRERGAFPEPGFAPPRSRLGPIGGGLLSRSSAPPEHAASDRTSREEHPDSDKLRLDRPPATVSQSQSSVVPAAALGILGLHRFQDR